MSYTPSSHTATRVLTQQRHSVNENSYLHTQRAYLFHTDVHRRLVRTWQWATCSMVVVACVLAGYVWMLLHARTVEVIYAQVDPTGVVLSTRMLGTNEEEIPLALMLPAVLQRWVIEARSVTSDREAQKAILDRVYQQTEGDARAVLDAYYAERNPLVNGETLQADVQVTSILQLSEESWQVRWEEHVRRQGKVVGVQKGEGQFRIRREPPITTESGLRDPIGLRVVEIRWAMEAK